MKFNRVLKGFLYWSHPLWYVQKWERRFGNAELVPHNTTRGEYNCLQPRRLSEKTTRRPSVSVHVFTKVGWIICISDFLWRKSRTYCSLRSQPQPQPQPQPHPALWLAIFLARPLLLFLLWNMIFWKFRYSLLIPSFVLWITIFWKCDFLAVPKFFSLNKYFRGIIKNMLRTF